MLINKRFLQLVAAGLLLLIPAGLFAALPAPQACNNSGTPFPFEEVRPVWIDKDRTSGFGKGALRPTTSQANEGRPKWLRSPPVSISPCPCPRSEEGSPPCDGGRREN